jgi:hypothetical protein
MAAMLLVKTAAADCWYFIVLQGLFYEISNSYSAATDDVLDIVRILKALKHIFLERTEV